MTYHDVILHFVLALENPIDGAAADLTRRLDAWNDGRYSFYTEMIHTGLVNTLARVGGNGGYVVENGGRALAVSVRQDGLDRKWRVLSRDDRQPDGSPGAYRMSRRRVFDDAESARTWAEGISPSRFPLIVEAERAEMVLAVLNAGAVPTAYEPPKATPVGNMRDLLNNVCGTNHNHDE